MKHKLARGALDVDSRRNDAHRRDPPAATARTTVICRRHRRCGRCRSASPSLGPSARVYKGSGNPVGGHSYQDLDVSCCATSLRRPGIGRFFGGSGSGPSRGALPFSFTENHRICAIVVKMEEE